MAKLPNLKVARKGLPHIHHTDMERPKERRPKERRQEPQAPDCCTMLVLCHGQSKTVVTAVGNSIEVDQKLHSKVTVDQKVNARAKGDAMVGVDANALGALPAAGADSDAISDTDSDSDSANKTDSDSDVVIKEKKAKDLLAKADEYTISWNIANAHGPVVVTIQAYGEAEGYFRCADQSGSLTVSNLKILQSDRPLTKAYVAVTVEAVDACGGRDRCEFNIREP